MDPRPRSTLPAILFLLGSTLCSLAVITVNEGVTLTIGPGSVVQLDPGVDIQLDGLLDIKGTTADPVFTKAWPGRVAAGP